MEEDSILCALASPLDTKIHTTVEKKKKERKNRTPYLVNAIDIMNGKNTIILLNIKLSPEIQHPLFRHRYDITGMKYYIRNIFDIFLK